MRKANVTVKAALLGLLLVAGTARGWVPDGWVYVNYPDVWSVHDTSWFVLDSATTLLSSDVSQGTWTAWSPAWPQAQYMYVAWPHAYLHPQGTTLAFAMDPDPSPVRVYDRKRNRWMLLGDRPQLRDNDAGTVLAVGDSITLGVPPGGLSPYPALMGGKVHKRVINGGFGGIRSGDYATRLQGLIDLHRPGYMTVLLGANDVIGGVQGATPANLLQIVKTANRNHVTVVLATLTPSASGKYGGYNAGFHATSQAIRNLCAGHEIRMADLEHAFGSGYGGLLSGDGFHPNQAGHHVIATTFARVIDRLP